MASAGALVLLSLMPYLHGLWWVLELPAHFRPHIAVVSSGLGILALALQRWRALALAAVAAAACWTSVLTTPSASAYNENGAVVVTQNLSFANGRAKETRQMLVKENPDIIVLQEYTPEWHQALTTVANQYQTTITVPREGAFGIAVYANLPIRSSEVLELGQTRVPAVVIDIEAPQLAATVAAVHFQPPMKKTWSADRNRQLDELSRYVQASKRDFVVVGDFNNTPYSPSLRAFIDETETRLGYTEWLPTWPAALSWAGIPIDLALASNGLQIGSVSQVDSVGSDHRGLRFSIAMKRSKETGLTD